MSASRRAHVSKSTTERSDYQQNVIRPKDRESPTLERLLPLDSTDSIAAVTETNNLAGSQPTARPWRLEAKTWAQVHALELVTSLFGLALLWLGSMVFTLNRETGELKQRIDAIDKATSDKSNEERVRHQIERLQDRLDTLRDHDPQTNSRAQPKGPRPSPRPTP